nr:hypothetical protein CFP56_70401 [Quercus suber]
MARAVLDTQSSGKISVVAEEQGRNLIVGERADEADVISPVAGEERTRISFGCARGTCVVRADGADGRDGELDDGAATRLGLCKSDDPSTDSRTLGGDRGLDPETPRDESERSMDSRKSSDDGADQGRTTNGQQSAVAEAGQIPGRYRNNLHPAVGYLDLANALDFPANVWNKIPIPVFALALMGLGGSIAILTVGFAIWDYRRSRRNVEFLKAERAWLESRLARSACLDLHIRLMLRAWQDISFRELGWEVIDRVLLDVSMGIAGILVGAGTLMAIRGDIPAVFEASNLMSGYIGNSLVVFYAFVNLLWSGYLFRRARSHHSAIRNADRIPAQLRDSMIRHGRRHEWYAALNGSAIAISSVGSMISATMWQGYVVLIPCVVGSVYCNWFWRKRLGYDRESAQVWLENGDLDLDARLQDLVAADAEKSRRRQKQNDESLDKVYETRFLLELYGCYLVIAQQRERSVDEEKIEEAIPP